MRKILIAYALLCATVAHATTYVPVPLLNPTGSSSGQAVVSTGPTTPPNWGSVGLNGIAAIAANTVLANATGSPAAPAAFSMPSCSTSASALNYTLGSGWSCNTAVLASNVSGTVAVLNGGTGATTAANARSNLGAAGSGANTDITSLNAPALGAATATTQAASSNSTLVATTAMVQAAFASPPCTGCSSPNAGAFTTLSTTAQSKVIALTTNAQSIPNNAFTQITTYTASLNQGSNLTASTGNYVTPAAAVYDVRAGVRFAAAAGVVATQVLISVFVNGSEMNQAGMVQQNTSTYNSQASGAWLVKCNAGDTITVRVFQNSGAAMTLDGSGTSNYLQVSQLP